MERPDTALSTQPVDLAAIATKAALEMESIAYEKCVTLETALPEACSLRGNPDYLQRIVSSLLGGEISVSSSAEDGTVFQVTLCR